MDQNECEQQIAKLHGKCERLLKERMQLEVELDRVNESHLNLESRLELLQAGTNIEGVIDLLSQYKRTIGELERRLKRESPTEVINIGHLPPEATVLKKLDSGERISEDDNLVISMAFKNPHTDQLMEWLVSCNFGAAIPEESTFEEIDRSVLAFFAEIVANFVFVIFDDDVAGDMPPPEYKDMNIDPEEFKIILRELFFYYFRNLRNRKAYVAKRRELRDRYWEKYLEKTKRKKAGRAERTAFSRYFNKKVDNSFEKKDKNLLLKWNGN